jgi:hypothetical protein
MIRKPAPHSPGLRFLLATNAIDAFAQARNRSADDHHEVGVLSGSGHRQELGQAELREHRGGLVGSLQVGLELQDLRRHLVLVDALGV